MNMKIQSGKIFIVVAFVISVAMPFSVFAAPSAGIKPSSIFYFLDIVSEKIDLFFTFSTEKKVEKALLYADERLAEIETVGLENKPEAVEKATKQYQSNIELATIKAKELEDEKAEKLLTTISESVSKHQNTLTEVYNKAPDNAKAAVEKALETSIKGYEQALAQVTKLQSEVGELKKRLAELERETAGAEETEVKKLRREIETLKSAQSQRQQPQTIAKIVEAPPTTPLKSTQPLEGDEIYERIAPSVVFIKAAGTGSGMIIESDGLVLTNAHVIEDRSSAIIKLNDKRIFTASVVGRDELLDVALLQIKGVSGLPTVELGNSEDKSLKRGQKVYAFGYPLGISGEVTFTAGVFSARQEDDGVNWIQTDAPIHGGNSGGPLVDNHARVIGVNTLAAKVEGDIGGVGLGFALPINLVRGLIPQLKSGLNRVEPKPIVTPEPTPPPPTQSPTPPTTPAPTPTPIPVPEAQKPEPRFTGEPRIISKKETPFSISFTVDIENAPHFAVNCKMDNYPPDGVFYGKALQQGDSVGLNSLSPGTTVVCTFYLNMNPAPVSGSGTYPYYDGKTYIWVGNASTVLIPAKDKDGNPIIKTLTFEVPHPPKDITPPAFTEQPKVTFTRIVDSKSFDASLTWVTNEEVYATHQAGTTIMKSVCGQQQTISGGCSTTVTFGETVTFLISLKDGAGNKLEHTVSAKAPIADDRLFVAFGVPSHWLVNTQSLTLGILKAWSDMDVEIRKIKFKFINQLANNNYERVVYLCGGKPYEIGPCSDGSVVVSGSLYWKKTFLATEKLDGELLMVLDKPLKVSTQKVVLQLEASFQNISPGDKLVVQPVLIEWFDGVNVRTDGIVPATLDPVELK